MRLLSIFRSILFLPLLSFRTHLFPVQLSALIRPTTYHLCSIPRRTPVMIRAPLIAPKLRVLMSTAFPEVHLFASLVRNLLITLVLSIVVLVLRGWWGRWLPFLLLTLFWLRQLGRDVFHSDLLRIIIVLTIILLTSIIVTFSTIPIELFYNDIHYDDAVRAYRTFPATKILTQLQLH